MFVKLVVHVERVDDRPVWWAESPDLPGFYSAADALPELQVMAKLAVCDILAQDDRTLDGLEYLLAPAEPPSGNSVDGVAGSLAPTKARAATGVAVVA